MSIWSTSREGDAWFDWNPEAARVPDAWMLSTAWSWTDRLRLTVTTGDPDHDEVDVMLDPEQARQLRDALNDLIAEQERRGSP